MTNLFTGKKCVLRTLLSMFLMVLMFSIGPMQDLFVCEVRAAETEETDGVGDADTDAADADTSDVDDTDADASSADDSADDKPDIEKPEGEGTAEEEVKMDPNGYPEGTLFIKEIRYFRGEHAKKKGANEGWIIHDANLNKGNKGDSLWLGYKTTTDKNEAITALKTMEMHGGYEITNYRKVMESTSKGIGELASAMMTIATEFKGNALRIPKTIDASREFLNLYILKNGGLKIGESLAESEKLLGDYFIAGDYKEEDIKTLIMMINPAVYGTIVSRLAAGLFTPETNFAEKVSGIVEKYKKLSSSALRNLDTRYQSTVMGMRDQLQTFSKKVRDAKERVKAAGGKIILSNGNQVEVDPDASGTKTDDVMMPSVEDVRKSSDRIADGEKTYSDLKTGDEDLMYLTQLNVLNRYNYDDETKLGDYIVAAGEASFGKLSELRRIYPIIMAMTPGQAALLRINGFACLTAGLEDGDKISSQLEGMLSELKGYLQEKGYIAAPVWSTEDYEFFGSDIAYTKKLLRTNAAGATFTDLTKTTALGRFWNEFSLASNMISSVCACAYSIVSYVTGAGGAVEMIVVGAQLLYYGAAAGAAATAVSGALLMVIGVCGLVALVILLISLLVWIGKTIYNALHEWDEYDYDEFKDIPRFIFDAEETGSGEVDNVRYYLVSDPESGGADLNCGFGKRWNALYYTKSTSAGDPICASSEDDFFLSVLGSYTEQAAGIEPVVSFGSPNAQSVNAYALEKNDGNQYLYYRTSLNGEMTRSSKLKDEKSKGEYLADLRLFNGETETEAKASLTKQGYKLYDMNVAPLGDSERQYTYIGYKTTNSPKAAIRDIRVSNGYPGSSVTIGEISYSAGESATDVTANNAALCYTSNEKYGSPIRWKDVFFVKNRSEAKEGWEPVSLICGGPAFNWHDTRENEVEKSGYNELKSYLQDNGLFMYYKPEKTYTDGETYISGIQIVAGTYSMTGSTGYILDDYMDELGVRPVLRVAEDVVDSADVKVKYVVAVGGNAGSGERDITNGFYKNYDVWLAYTTTHNPYRALTDIKFYRSGYTDSAITPNLVVGRTGYTACEKYCQVIYTEDGKNFLSRYYGQDHAVLSPGIDGERFFNPRTRGQSLVSLYRSGSDKVKQESTGLYVSGYTVGAEPIREKDLAIKDTPGAPEGFGQISEFLNIYDDSDIDLGFNASKGKSNHAYMYVRGMKKATRPKYIKSVSSMYVETPTEIEQNEEKVELNGEQMAMYTTALTEQLRAGLIQSGAEEVVMTDTGSLAMTGKGAADARMQSLTYSPGKVREDDKIPQRMCYLGIARTDKETEAIRGMIKYRQIAVNTDISPASSIVVGGVDYTSAGGCFKDTGGLIYALYTSRNTGAGEPITDIFIDKEPFVSSTDTMLGASEVDKGEGIKRVFASTSLDSYETLFLHMKRSNSEKGYYSRLVTVGSMDPLDNLRTMQIKLLSAGCNRCIPLDMNKNAGGQFVLIGARTCSTSSTDIAIRDIVVTVGKEHVDSYTSPEGYEYISAGNVSLNEGTSYGKKLYLYYTHGVKIEQGSADDLISNTTDTDNTPTDTGIEDEDDLGDWLDDNDEDETRVVYMNKKPVIGLAATERDFLPETIPGMNWVKILDQNDARVNANDGVVYRVNDFNMVDNRIYLYCAHEGGQVYHPASRITETDGKYRMVVGVLKFIKK